MNHRWLYPIGLLGFWCGWFDPCAEKVFRRGTGLLLMVLFLGGCSASLTNVHREVNIENACAIFDERSGWYKSVRQAEQKWGVPIHIQLAIIHQESKFVRDARPPRTHLFWFIPGPRASSAFGYAQALDGTWEWYKKKTGNRGADRDDFDDAVDFIGWYVDQSHRQLGISKWDAEKQYLAYHEGHSGYAQKTYLGKPWLLKVAAKVARNAARYHSQLAACKNDLPEKRLFWPF